METTTPSATAIVESLNPDQQKAVTTDAHNVLVLAGAGSGKTRVLVHRIAWLIDHENVSPSNILAVTFTNKAAAEMRSRIHNLLGIPTQSMWVGTFHGIAHRLLRAHWQAANLPQTFQIIDAEDQYRLVRRIIRNMNLDENKWPPRQAQWFINNQKEAALRSKDVKSDGQPFTDTMLRIYQEYEQSCERSNLVDFSELLLRAFELWKNNPDILEHYQQRFSRVLVDEFQDTNTIQYNWLRMLAEKTGDTMVVGDDDQSIYGWRGAKIENIHHFCQHFKDVVTIRLEQNYRSTKTILSAANAVIAHNEDRLGKELWTEGDHGEKINLYAAINETDEAHHIVSMIKDALVKGTKPHEMAILYRSNAQSRVLEEQLAIAGIPYRVYGGLRFFERAEIKDALAYLRLIQNHHDDAAFERIVNTPTRGIGHSTMNQLREYARTHNVSLWETTKTLIADNALTRRAMNATSQFIALIDKIAADAHTSETPCPLTLTEQVKIAIDGSGLITHYQKEKGERGLSRIDNVNELLNAATQFSIDNEDNDNDLATFLAYTALEAGESQEDNIAAGVQLMTLHAAKGLEFPHVFIAGLEDGLFPHRMSMAEPHKLQEERRLCYVGITRAMKSLTLTYAETRRLHGGTESYQRKSRFIKEIPPKFLGETRLKTKVSRPSSFCGAKVSSGKADTPFYPGQRVHHTKFGDGIVLNFDGVGSSARVQVNFGDFGTKWLVTEYAKLETCD